MESNICTKFYGSEDKDTRRLADGIGYLVADSFMSEKLEFQEHGIHDSVG
jgi:hypothetical protein